MAVPKIFREAAVLYRAMKFPGREQCLRRLLEWRQQRLPSHKAFYGGISLDRLDRLQYLPSFHVLQSLDDTRRPTNLDELGSGVSTQACKHSLVTGRLISVRSVNCEMLRHS